MLIGKNWKIEADELNVILYKRQGQKLGEKAKYQWKAIGFYSTVANALKDLVNYEIRATGLKDLQTVVNKIDELNKRIDGLKGVDVTGTFLGAGCPSRSFPQGCQEPERFSA